MAVLSEYLPVLLFGVLGGATADRFDRRRMVIAVNLVRALVLAVLVATIVGEAINIGVVLVVLFVLGTAETFADSASSTLVPGLVARDDLGTANARMQGALPAHQPARRAPDRRSAVCRGHGHPVRDERRCASCWARCWSRESSRASGRPPSTDPVCARRWPKDCAGCSTTRRCGPSPSRSSCSTSRSAPRGRCWSCTRTSGWAWDRSGSGSSRRPWPSAGSSGWSCTARLERRFSLGDIMRVGLLIETGTHLSLALTTSAGGRPGHHGRVRRPRVRVGHDLHRRPAARRARRAARPRERRVPRRDRRRPRDRDAAGRTARAAPTGSRRRSGSGSSARRCWSSSCGASSTTSRTPRRAERRRAATRVAA